jgi:hypothetical protein
MLVQIPISHVSFFPLEHEQELCIIALREEEISTPHPHTHYVASSRLPRINALLSK